MRFTTLDQDFGYGGRVPAVFAWKDGTSQFHGLHVSMSLNDQANHWVDIVRIPTDEWFKLTISQQPISRHGRVKIFFLLINIEVFQNGGMYYNIRINDQLEHRLQNYKPRTFRNIKVYARDNFENYPTANASIRNLSMSC